MLRLFLKLPLFVQFIAVAAVAMLVPALHAASLRDWPVAQAFAQAGLLVLIGFALLAVVTRDLVPERPARSYLVALVAAYSVLPAILALPFYEALGDTRFVLAWFEMVSSVTTTGASLYDSARLPPSLHLWRAMVAWMGGFLILVAAIAIFAPLNLGGFEVISGDVTEDVSKTGPITRIADGRERMARFASQLLPIYGGLTLVLWIGLSITGEPPLEALCLAMSTMSTSGITAQPGPVEGFGTELLIFLFLTLSVSRRFFARDTFGLSRRGLWPNREALVALICVSGVTMTVFLRHWVGAFDVSEETDLAAVASALWGTLFTAFSFLTTTGFESGAWDSARDWSGLGAPGLVLMGLSLFGGGVATTAGGVKLLRIYALYTHGKREVERLIHPSSVGGSGVIARRIRRKGAQVAWIFFMLMALSTAVTMGLLALSGVDFESALALSLAALTTTGPLADAALDTTGSFAAVGDLPRLVLAVAMIVGRLETLAFVALLNPDLWRR